jgi:hypothetical protein
MPTKKRFSEVFEVERSQTVDQIERLALSYSEPQPEVIPEPEKVPEKINLAGFKEFSKLLDENKIFLPEFKAYFKTVINSKDELLTEIDKTYTLEKLKRLFYTNRDKKKDYVDSYYSDMLHLFALGKGVIYSFSKNETRESRIGEIVEKVTEKDLSDYSQKRQIEIAENEARFKVFKKSLDNPETLEEFEKFIAYKGGDKLSPEQKQTWERLKGEQLFQKELKAREEKATVKQVEVTADLSIAETIHSQSGDPLFVVKLSDRVSKEEYTRLNAGAKRLGGYYSKWTKGFTFKTREAAEKLLQLKEGDVSKIEDKTETNTERLLTFAEGLEEKAREKLNQDRKTNTYRRQRMAAGAEADAERNIFFAKIVRNVANGIAEGSATYLQNVKFATDIETLNSIYEVARYAAKRIGAEANKVRYDEYQPTEAEILENVKFPYPEINNHNWKDLINQMAKTKGFVMLAKRLEKYAKKTDYSRKLVQQELIKEAYEAISGLPTADNFRQWEKENVKKQFEGYNRLNRLAITSILPLKAAIKEFIQFRQVDALSPEEKADLELKQAERKFQLDKQPGFFPTPYDLAKTIALKADLQPGNKVLEPSAGIGHLAQAIIDIEPEINLTCIEYYVSYAEHTRAKGFEVLNQDFLSYTEGGYDKIIMNPPFENNQDIAHIQHAFTLLKPGGRLVAIMANRAGQNKAANFFEFVDENGYWEQNQEGAFKSAFKPTGVNTITVVLDKPQAATKVPEIKSQALAQPATPATTIKSRIEALKLSYEVLEDDTIKTRIEALEIAIEML